MLGVESVASVLALILFSALALPALAVLVQRRLRSSRLARAYAARSLDKAPVEYFFRGYRELAQGMPGDVGPSSFGPPVNAPVRRRTAHRSRQCPQSFGQLWAPTDRR